MKIIYIREAEETCDIIKRIINRIKMFFYIIKVEIRNNNILYYIPIFKNNRISKYRIKKLSYRINKLLEKDGTSTIVLSGNLSNNQLLKNYLFSKNINILDGRYLFKCLIYEILEYIFKIKNKEIELRRSLYIN